MTPEPLTGEQITDRLAGIPGWTLIGDRISRTYTFDDHLSAAAAVPQIAAVQEELGHHADLTVNYDTVTASVNTHSAGGKVTALDLNLARRLERLAAELDWA